MSGVRTRRKAWDALASDQFWYLYDETLGARVETVLRDAYIGRFFNFKEENVYDLYPGFLRTDLPQIIIDCADEVVSNDIWFYAKFKKEGIEEADWERERQLYFRWLGENMENYLARKLYDIQYDLSRIVDYNKEKLKGKIIANYVFLVKEALSLLIAAGIGALIAKWGKLAIRGGGKVIKPIATKVAARFVPKPTPDNIQSITLGAKNAFTKAGQFLAKRSKGKKGKWDTQGLNQFIDDIERILLNCVNNPNVDRAAARAGLLNKFKPVFEKLSNKIIGGNNSFAHRILGAELIQDAHEGMAQLFAENIAEWLFNEIAGDTIQTLDVIGWDWLKNKIGIKEEEFVIWRDGLNLIIPGMGDETFRSHIFGYDIGPDINFDDFMGYVPVASTIQSGVNCVANAWVVSVQVEMLVLTYLFGYRANVKRQSTNDLIMNELRTITNNNQIEDMLKTFSKYPFVDSPFDIICTHFGDVFTYHGTGVEE